MLVRNLSTGTVTFGENEFSILSGVTADIPEDRYEALKSEFDALVAIGQIEVFFGELSYNYEFIPITKGVDATTPPDALEVLTDSNKVMIRKFQQGSGPQSVYFYWKVPDDLVGSGNIAVRAFYFATEPIPFPYTGAITKFTDNGSGKTIVTSAGHGMFWFDPTPVVISVTTNYNGSWNIFFPDSINPPDEFTIDTPFVGDDATGTWSYTGGDQVIFSIQGTVLNDGTVLGAVPLDGTYVNFKEFGGAPLAVANQQIITGWSSLNLNAGTLAALTSDSVLELLFSSANSSAPVFYHRKVGVAGIELRYERLISR